MSYPGKIIFIVGVSGSGKNTMIHELLKSDLPLVQVISYKTRPLREDERDGVDYHYMTEEQFQAAAHAGEFLEYKKNHGLYRYATGKREVIEKLEEGKYIIKDIDIKGLIEIQTHHPEIWEVSKSIFLDIPEETMKERIHKRGAIGEEELVDRLASAVEERALAKEHCTDIIDASGTIEEEAAHVYAIVATYCKSEQAPAFISSIAL